MIQMAVQMPAALARGSPGSLNDTCARRWAKRVGRGWDAKGARRARRYAFNRNQNNFQGRWSRRSWTELARAHLEVAALEAKFVPRGQLRSEVASATKLLLLSCEVQRAVADANHLWVQEGLAVGVRVELVRGAPLVLSLAWHRLHRRPGSIGQPGAVELVRED